MHRETGSLIGAVGGPAFLLFNTGSLPVAVSMRTYWLAVLAMAIAIPLGSLLVNGVLDRPVLTLPWVVLVLGAHFIPFARAFRAPIFAWLGLAVVALGVAGALAVLLVDARAVVWLAVAAGFVLLGFSFAGGRQRSATLA